MYMSALCENAFCASSSLLTTLRAQALCCFRLIPWAHKVQLLIHKKSFQTQSLVWFIVNYKKNIYIICVYLEPGPFALFSIVHYFLHFCVCSASLSTKSLVCMSSTPLYGSLVTSLVKRKMFSLHALVRTSLARSKTSIAARQMTRCVIFVTSL